MSDPIWAHLLRSLLSEKAEALVMILFLPPPTTSPLLLSSLLLLPSLFGETVTSVCVATVLFLGLISNVKLSAKKSAEMEILKRDMNLWIFSVNVWTKIMDFCSFFG